MNRKTKRRRSRETTKANKPREKRVQPHYISYIAKIVPHPAQRCKLVIYSLQPKHCLAHESWQVPLKKVIMWKPSGHLSSCGQPQPHKTRLDFEMKRKTPKNDCANSSPILIYSPQDNLFWVEKKKKSYYSRFFNTFDLLIMTFTFGCKSDIQSLYRLWAEVRKHKPSLKTFGIWQ